MLDKPIEAIDSEDLSRLHVNGVAESRSLEYKQHLPGNSDDDRREFLKDVSSFANTAGGHLLYGVTAARGENGSSTGLIERFCGLAGANTDAELLRLEQIIRDGLEPRLPGVRFKWISGLADGPVLVLKVPRSWAAPHMVKYKGWSRFFGRHSAGSYQLDVSELRRAFLEGGLIPERVRTFRNNRVESIVDFDTPISLTGSQLAVIHVVPHESAVGEVDVDLARANAQRDYLEPVYATGFQTRYNLDGLMSYSEAGNRQAISYLQLFRTGAIESVTSELLWKADEALPSILPGLTLAESCQGLLSRSVRLLQLLSVEPPASVFLTLTGMAEVTLGVSDNHRARRYYQAHQFDRAIVSYRDLLLTSWEELDPAAVLKPLFDEVWQSAGIERCNLYSDQGVWAPRT